MVTPELNGHGSLLVSMEDIRDGSTDCFFMEDIKRHSKLKVAGMFTAD